MVSKTLPGKTCLDDTVLLAIAQGRMAEPALGHFLAHLENCLDCCLRSEWLGKQQPSGINALIDNFARKEKNRAGDPITPEIKEYSWQKKMQSMSPSLPQPKLNQSNRAGTTQFGHWDILGILGEGRAAVVYLARDKNLGREVALKVLRPDVAAIRGMAESFLGEAKAMAQVRDPHLVVLYSHGSEPQPFLEMELLEGQTLAQALEKGPFEPKRALEIARDVATGLAALHSRGLVHRDIKPANIWLQTRSGKEHAVLMDLGLVAFGTTRSGTPGYMAPELLTGEAREAHPASDIFSLGALLRTMVLGGDSGSKAHKIPDSNLAPLIQSLMADLPEKRPSAGEVVAYTEKELRQTPLLSRRIVVGSAAGALLVGGLGLLSLIRKSPWKSPTPKSSPGPTSPGFAAQGVFKNAFSQQQTNLLLGFHVLQGCPFVLTPMGMHRFNPDKGVTQTASMPFLIERFSLSGDRAVIANSAGQVEIWDISQQSPKRIHHFDLPKGEGSQLISVSLAPNGSGNLLVALREMVYTAFPVGSQYPQNLVANDEAKLFANNLQPASMALDDTGIRVLGIHGRGGVTLHELGEDHKQIWAFRPFVQGPAIHAFRPGHPGEIALGSPLGDVSLHGPEIIRQPRANPILGTKWMRKLPGRLLEMAFLHENLLVVQTNQGPCPLKYTLANLEGQVWHDLACPSPVSITADQTTGTLYCLDSSGSVLTWRAEDLIAYALAPSPAP